ncbi:MAG: hypothetical protein A3H02_01660 [Candidatus Niyogibacteria bacterium RIFCSPLOWO2_12_FULL_41_13]|uniref:PrgI family protein n=1 Tax=Candidatus Niyogibacteria bacterium RIFCSPLOWO2_12_FULL_41_13 TaxID=1801726 RepID=A0A1G2F1V6_9BACT|nr:MAG: hypothetical protein A3H02_01660 [Candidatus Niyogibacteria bacterium RIFCSPLOWO2_12_FULL_41_13]
MRFHVPQFIEVEPKIFGPLTFKQFIYLIGGGALVFIAWTFLPRILAYIVVIPLAGFAVALAFYKVNGQPFINVLNNAIDYSSGAKLYIWKRVKKEKKEIQIPGAKQEGMINLPKLTESRLKDLAWSLEIKKEIRGK